MGTRAKIILFSFIFFTLVNTVTADFIFNREFPDDPKGGARGSSHANWFDYSVTSPAAATKKREFWLSNNRDGHGLGFRVLQNPELMADVLPGYEKSMTDSALWDDYFSRHFSIEVWTSVFAQKGRNHFFTYLSNRGCVEVFKKYSADIILVGSSEVFKDIVPRRLADETKRSDFSGGDPKVLSCEASGMLLDHVQFWADSLIPVKVQKAHWIVFGFSLFDGYEGSPTYLETLKTVFTDIDSKPSEAVVEDNVRKRASPKVRQPRMDLMLV